ncbi:MAG: gamma-glutamyltransferase [Propionibacteriales bacterium]|nr:gamma-glutamyltransferase [Propionibacteriales bacterium]
MTARGIAVAAPNDGAAQAGVRVAADGGNAVDAATAAALVTMTTEPGVVSLASGAYVTVLPPDGSPPVTVDGWVEMPGRGLPPERFGQGVWDITTEYGGGTTMTIGHGSVATPGSLKALDLAHRAHGLLPWARVVEPAVEAAEGFPHGDASHRYLSHVHELVFGWHPDSHAALHDDAGELIGPGDTVVVPHLAATLRQIADQGAETLYTGDLAGLIADDMAANGGILTRADLAAYDAVVRPALEVRTGDWRFATNPSPAVGGVVTAAMLTLLDGVPARGAWSPLEVGQLVRVEAAVLGARLAELDLEDTRVARAEQLLATVAADGLRGLGSPSTAHVSAVDDHGAACAVTMSAGYSSGAVTPGTGLWLNNALGEQELNHAGVHSLPPGTRLTSNMAPTVGRRDSDGAVLAIGSPGSDRISTALAQVLALFVNGGLDLHSAIAHPRAHVRVRNDMLVDHEDDLELPADLPLLSRTMPAHSMYFGGVGAAMWTPSIGLLAAGDPRRTGAVAVHTLGT